MSTAETAHTGQPTGRAMGSHQSHRAGTTTWLTPPHIIEALGPFDLDPCAAPGWETATHHYVLPTDGLAEPWWGAVWLNPPYGAEAWTWLDRLAEHAQTLDHHGVALIFARTETAGFVEQVWHKADAVLFLHGRLHFHYPDGTRAAANSGAPSCLVAYGEGAVERLEKCGLPGSLVSAWRPAAMRYSPADQCPTCIHPEGYDRLSGPCPTCHGEGIMPSAWWQVRHVESGATVPCRDRAEAEAHVRESASGPWVAEMVNPPGQSEPEGGGSHG